MIKSNKKILMGSSNDAELDIFFLNSFNKSYISNIESEIFYLLMCETKLLYKLMDEKDEENLSSYLKL
jgi:hypothetical protein